MLKRTPLTAYAKAFVALFIVIAGFGAPAAVSADEAAPPAASADDASNATSSPKPAGDEQASSHAATTTDSADESSTDHAATSSSTSSVASDKALKAETKVSVVRRRDWYYAGLRIRIRTNVTDPTGVRLVRIYFRDVRESHFNFVVSKEVGDGQYEAVLPAPSIDTQRIEYVILSVNSSGMVARTPPLEMRQRERQEAADLPEHQLEPDGVVNVYTELPTTTAEVGGFTDHMTLDVVVSAARFGLVANAAALLYTQTSDSAGAGSTGGAAAEGAAGGAAAGGAPTGVATVVTAGVATELTIGTVAIVGGAVAIAAGGGAAIAVSSSGGGSGGGGGGGGGDGNQNDMDELAFRLEQTAGFTADIDLEVTTPDLRTITFTDGLHYTESGNTVDVVFIENADEGQYGVRVVLASAPTTSEDTHAFRVIILKNGQAAGAAQTGTIPANASNGDVLIDFVHNQ